MQLAILQCHALVQELLDQQAAFSGFSEAAPEGLSRMLSLHWSGSEGDVLFLQFAWWGRWQCNHWLHDLLPRCREHSLSGFFQ